MISFRRTLYSVAAAAALALSAAPQAAEAQASLLSGLGGPAGYGTNYLDYNDDGFTSIIPLAPAFPAGLRFFRAMPWQHVIINNNGNINFVAAGTASGCFQYTPSPIPLPAGTCGGWPMIAPWWADVDTRGGGRPTHNGLFYDLRPGQMVVTWYQVGVFASNDTVRNTFQVIIRSSPECGDGDFDIEFRYNRCDWYVGSASGGNPMGQCDSGRSVEEGGSCTPAQVGFDSGDGVHFYTLAGSRTRTVRDICMGSNTGMPGVYRFQIRGGELPCMGSGNECTVSGNQGVCAAGHIQCRGGMPQCVADTGPSPERCDGADNDCNGMVDDGSNLCTPGFVCDRGSCVPSCVEGSCFEGQTCTMRNTCVDTECLTVTCAQGEICQHGTCVPACNNIRCPPPTTCRLGRCIDPCDGVTCDPGNVCENGLCVLSCRCRPCGAGQACGPMGTCVPAECVTVTCGPSEFCRAGMCINACDVAMCPENQVCDPTEGRCIPAIAVPDAGPGPEASVRDAATDSGSSEGGAGDGGVRDGAATGDSGSSEGGMAADAAACFGSACRPVTQGCHCSTTGANSRGAHPALLLGALGALFAVARRRRRA